MGGARGVASCDQPHRRGGGSQPSQDCQDCLVHAGLRYDCIVFKQFNLDYFLSYQNGIVVDRAEEQIHADTFWQTGPGDKYTR